MEQRVKVWTKQHAGILEDLEQRGRYIAKNERIRLKMEEHAELYLDFCDWYFAWAGLLVLPPPGVRYPVWVSLKEEEKIGGSDGNVLLEIEVDKAKLHPPA